MCTPEKAKLIELTILIMETIALYMMMQFRTSGFKRIRQMNDISSDVREIKAFLNVSPGSGGSDDNVSGNS